VFTARYGLSILNLMQADFRLQSYLSSATGLNNFLQVCSEVLISLSWCISSEESVRNSREHNTTSSLLVVAAASWSC
jgi:hypothetical protein